ncbi:hypothetical protein CF640_37265, partial [Burkholderia pseudomallei]
MSPTSAPAGSSVSAASPQPLGPPSVRSARCSAACGSVGGAPFASIAQCGGIGLPAFACSSRSPRAIARGDLELHAKAGKPIPPHWAIDANGAPPTDPQAALQRALRTLGGPKGWGLAALTELPAGALVGDMPSADARAVDEGAGPT